MAPPASSTHRVDVGDGGAPIFVKRATDEAGASRLRTEAVVLRALAHPATVRLVALVDGDGATELHLAWAGSHTLDTITGVTPRGAAEIVSALAATVADVHAAGLVHGRLTPDHVVLGAGGRPVLAGFADAVAVDRGDRADDVAALGSLLAALVTPLPAEVVLPESRWGPWWEWVRNPVSGRGRPRRDPGLRAALLVLADRARADDPTIRPSAGELAALLRETAGIEAAAVISSRPSPEPPEGDRVGRPQLRRHEEEPLGLPAPVRPREARRFTLDEEPVAASMPERPAPLWTRALGGGAWVVALVASALLLHRLGTGLLAAPPLLDRDEMSRWLAERDAVVVAFALVRLAGLGLTVYLLVVTALGVVARLSRVPALVAAVDVATVPPVRRVLGALAGASLAAAATSLAAAHTLAPRTVPVVAPPDGGGGAPPGATTPTTPTTTVETDPGRDPDGGPSTTEAPTPVVEEPEAVPPTVAGAGDEPARGSPPGRWTVEPGDHLWSVAETTLARAWGRPPSDAELDPYWRAVVEANRAHLLDPGNPDLVRPGQVLTLPTPPRDDAPPR